MLKVREFEENCERTGRRYLKKDAFERGLHLKLGYPCPFANTEEGKKLHGKKVGATMRIKEEESRTKKKNNRLIY